MKKILSLTLMLITAFALSAQINTNIWGTTLGKSTKEQVKRVIKKKGYRYEEIDNSIFRITPIKGLDFAGKHWDSMQFCFYKNTLYEITFLNFLDSDLKNDFDNLSYRLDKKYQTYYEFSTDYGFSYNDGKTRILVLLMNSGNLSISYINTRLEEQKKKAEDDEL